MIAQDKERKSRTVRVRLCAARSLIPVGGEIMSRIVGGVVVLLLALPALRADDKPNDKPPTPEEQYKALLKEQADAMTAYGEAYQKAETSEEKDKVYEEKFPRPEKLAPKFLELAEKNPTDPVAVDALIWVVTNATRDLSSQDSPRVKAIAVLMRDYLQSDKMAGLCQSLAYGYDKAAADLLRAVLEKNPKAEAQAEACLGLAQRSSLKAQLIHRLKEGDPGLAKTFERTFGKEFVEEMAKADAGPFEAESARRFKDFGDQYAAHMKPERLTQLCQRLGQIGGAAGETLLRALLLKDDRGEVKGVACLALAQSLKSRADNLPEAQAKDADKLRQESEELFLRAGDQFSAVKFGRGTVGEKAKGELFELRNLSIGKTAPEIEGEDADSKKFKLSDYRGKVVLLDFWGNW
jgi:hypothetical protein